MKINLNLLTFEQYAKKIGVSKKTIYNRFKQGTLTNVRIHYIGKQPHIIETNQLTKK
jgi:hypothetical protein